MTTGDAHMERSPRFISMVRMAKNAETASTLVITSASISSIRAVEKKVGELRTN